MSDYKDQENPFEENENNVEYEDDPSSADTSDYSTDGIDDEKSSIAINLSHHQSQQQYTGSHQPGGNKAHDSSDFEGNLKTILGPSPQCYEKETEGYHTWEINNLADLKKDKNPGPKFKVGNYEFNLLLMIPDKRSPSTLYSCYLEGHPIDENSDDNDWHCCAQFAIDAWDQEDPSIHKSNAASHRYTSKVTDWGFVGLLNSRVIQEAKMIKSNKVNITAYVRIIKDHTGVLWHNFLDYDSKKETGYVGINNQGATCYLNSLLQSYYFTKIFRKKVYQIPTDGELNTKLENFQQYLEQPKSVSLALQRIFYNLQTSGKPIDTLELTQSFGWNSADAFTQHDVQELNRILMDRLESKMKNTDIEGCLNDIFVGNMKSFIRCVNVEYESSRTEDFWDIQLNVKNLKNIRDSFKNYIELEMLDGDNKYDAPEFGLQDAEKGVVFESFPPVLHLQLKRFEYDFEYDQLIKINDRYEFFDSIDLKPYLDKESVCYDEDWEYQLHGVLVHQGDVSMGHYYAMIKPTPEDKWFRFDDDRVWQVTAHQVFEGNFGADRLTQDPRTLSKEEQQEYQMKRHTSAYMLVYIRKSKVPEILDEVEDLDTPIHLAKQIKYEHDEMEIMRKQREEMHLYTNFKIYVNKGYLRYEGFDLGPNEEDRINFSEDLYDPESFSLKFRMLKSEPFSKVYEKVAELLGEKSDPAGFRFWNIVGRHSFAARPFSDIPYTYGSEKDEETTIADIVQFVEQNITRSRRINQSSQLVLFLEETSKDLRYISQAYYSLKKNDPRLVDEVEKLETYSEKIEKIMDLVRESEFKPRLELIPEDASVSLIFIKYFDQNQQLLRGLTHIVIPVENQIEYLTKLLNNVMNFEINTPLRFYEELGANQIQGLIPSKSFYKSELSTGDIICFTKESSELEPNTDVEFKSVDEYYGFLANRVHFRVTPLIKADEDEEEYVKVDISEAKDEDVSTEKRSNSTRSTNKEFDFWFSTSSDYNLLAKKIGENINVNPDYIRIFILGHSNQRIPLKRDTNFARLINKTPKSQTLDLQYEILKVTLAEFEEMKLCKVSWVGQGICREQKHEFFLPRSSTIDNLIVRLQTKVNIKNEDRDNLVCWSAKRFTIDGIHSLNATIDSFDQVIIGNYPNFKELLENGGSESVKLIPGFQFFGQLNNKHSIPFIFDIVKGEEFVDTKVRLHKLLGMSEKEFNSLRVGISDLQSVEYLDSPKRDTVVLFDTCIKNDSIHICIDHPDRNVRRGSTFEPSIFIRE